MLLIVAQREKMLFELVIPILRNLFLRAKLSESECLAVRDRSFAVHRVASVHAEILVFVRGH